MTVRLRLASKKKMPVSDKDGDGKLSTSEWAALQSAVDAKLEEKYQAALSKTTTDEAKQKIKAQFEKIKASVKTKRSAWESIRSDFEEGKLKAKWETLRKTADKDGDGKISENERKELQTAVDAELEAMYKSALSKASDEQMKENITKCYNQLKAKLAAKRTSK